jgi:hypothetical protein
MHYGFGKRQLHSIALSSERLGAAPLVIELTSAQIEFVGQRPAETLTAMFSPRTDRQTP